MRTNQLSAMISSTLFSEARTVLLKLMLAVGRVEQAIQFCLKEKGLRFQLPTIFLAVILY